jgi:hypothetical protein
LRTRLLVTLPALFVLLSCASSGSLPGTGQDGSGASAGAANGRIPSHRQPTDDELLSAFDTQAPPATSGPRAVDPALAVAPLPPEEDPLAHERVDFDREVGQLKASLRAREAQASVQAQALVRRAQKLGPTEQVTAHQLTGQALELSGDDGGASAAAMSQLRACGPPNPDACRRQAQTQAGRLAARAKDSRTRALLDALAAADRCLGQAERAVRSGQVPGCLTQAEADYRRADDERMVARARLARARTLASREQTHAAAAREFDRAAAACASVRCADLHRKALGALAGLELARGNLEAAAHAALRDVKAGAQALPAPERRWAWTELATQICKRYDEQSGPGRCRALERQLTGEHAFMDFSRPAATTEGLCEESVRAVSAHYGFLMDRCLKDQAQRLIPPAEERYQVRWTVANDGTVAEMRMDRQDRQHGPLAKCLREQLAHWRYPKYRGELQHVEQQFVVSARAALRAH